MLFQHECPQICLCFIFQFPDVVSFCDQMADKGKIVIVAALDGTFQRQVSRSLLSYGHCCKKTFFFLREQRTCKLVHPHSLFCISVIQSHVNAVSRIFFGVLRGRISAPFPMGFR